LIRPARDARGEIQIRITVPAQNRWKTVLSDGARQESLVSPAWATKQLAPPSITPVTEPDVQS
jgi:hypothetical protein